jgi:hypothetical protein
LFPCLICCQLFESPANDINIHISDLASLVGCARGSQMQLQMEMEMSPQASSDPPLIRCMTLSLLQLQCNRPRLDHQPASWLLRMSSCSSDHVHVLLQLRSSSSHGQLHSR